MSPPRRIVIGTRGSALARWQTDHVRAALEREHPDLSIEVSVIRTEGDIDQTSQFGTGDRGVFVKRIEQALVAGRIDLAVHSLKDLPTTQPEGLVVAAVPERHDPRDALVTRDGRTLAALEPETVLRTGSYRRRTQLLSARPDLRCEGLRGNVDTRLGKVASGEADAIVLAVAGMERLGLDRVPYTKLDRDLCLPAVGQGALAIECRADDAELRECLAVLDHGPSRCEVEAERAFLRRLGGGCLAPATSHAQVDGNTIRLRAVVGDIDGKELLRDEVEGGAAEGVALGEAQASRLLDRGAGDVLDEARRRVGG